MTQNSVMNPGVVDPQSEIFKFLCQDIVNGVYYVHGYQPEIMKFSDHDIDNVDEIVIFHGEEFDFPEQYMSQLRENIEYSQVNKIIYVCAQGTEYPKVVTDQQRHNNHRATFGAEFVDYCEARGTELYMENWPHFFMGYTAKQITDANNGDLSDLCIHGEDFSKITQPFLSYNGVARDHRTQFIDALIETDMLDQGIVTYGWKFFLPEGEVATGDHLISGGYAPKHGDIQCQDRFLPRDGSLCQDELPYIHSYTLTEEFLQGFLHVVCETLCEGDDAVPDLNRMVCTEKTYLPVLHLRPVLVLSNPGWHHVMWKNNLGLELYDEIFDYEFDFVESRAGRIMGIIKNIQNLIERRSEWPEIFATLLPKMRRNRDRVLQSLTDPKLMPDTYYRALYNQHYKMPEAVKQWLHFFEIGNHDKHSHFDMKIPVKTTYSIVNYHEELERVYLAHLFELLNNPKWDKRILWNGSTEWQPHIDPQISKFCFEHDIHIDSIWFGDQDYLDKRDDVTDASHTAHSVPMRFFDMVPEAEWYVQDHDNPDWCEITHAGLCLLARPHRHRIYLFQELLRRGLDTHDRLNLSYNGDLYEGECAHFYDDPLVTDKTILFKHIEADNFGEHWSSWQLHPEYHNTLFDFATECNSEVFAYSEKTVKPVVNLKPFVLLGCENLNRNLRDTQGIEIFDEIIDYGFEDSHDLYKRCRGYADQIEKICLMPQDELQDVYRMLWPKLRKNLEWYNKYITTGDIPDVLLERYSRYLDAREKYNRALWDQSEDFNPHNDTLIARIKHVRDLKIHNPKV
jgi:hypothetical protein